MTTASSKRRVRESRGPLYVDASALVKLYLPEPESAGLERFLRAHGDLVVSDLAVTEVISSLSRRLREGAVPSDAAVRVHEAVLGHLKDGVYGRIELVPAVHREAERILLSVARVSLRAADALHVALALAAGAAVVVTYDRRLASAARAVGLAAHP